MSNAMGVVSVFANVEEHFLPDVQGGTAKDLAQSDRDFQNNLSPFMRRTSEHLMSGVHIV